MEAKSHNIYNVRRSVNIGVRNEGGTLLSNCKVHCKVAAQDVNGAPQEWMLVDAFTLNPGEERYVCLAAYNEAIPPHPEGMVGIQMAAPPSGNFWHPPILPKAGGAVSIVATSAESRPCEAICRLWVEGGKFKWEKV